LTPSMTSALVLGALSGIGRHLVEVLVNDSEITDITAVDYSLVQLAYLQKRFVDCFQKVKYIQANILRKEGMRYAFGNRRYDYVFNCTSTKAEQVEQYYVERLLNTAVNAAEMVVATKSGVFVHFSSSAEYVYTAGVGSKEEDEQVAFPGSLISKYTMLTAKTLREMSELPLVEIRIPTSLGAGDRGPVPSSVVMCCVLARNRIPFPDTSPPFLERSFVHFVDAARAALFLAKYYRSNDFDESNRVQVFNAAATPVTLMSEYIRVFKAVIPHYETNCDQMTEVPTPEAVQEMIANVNELFLDFWMELLEKYNIRNTPLQPYIEADGVAPRFWNTDSSKLEKLGFKFEHTFSEDVLRRWVQDELEVGILPPLEED